MIPSALWHNKTHFKKGDRVFSIEKKEIQKRSLLTGCYVIETSGEALSAREICQLYTTLTKIEYAFKPLKSDLGIRPVYHQLADRMRGRRGWVRCKTIISKN